MTLEEKAKRAYELWERQNHVPRFCLYKAILVGIRVEDGIYLFKNRFGDNVTVTLDQWEELIQKCLKCYPNPTIILVPNLEN